MWRQQFFYWHVFLLFFLLTIFIILYTFRVKIRRKKYAFFPVKVSNFIGGWRSKNAHCIWKFMEFEATISPVEKRTTKKRSNSYQNDHFVKILFHFSFPLKYDIVEWSMIKNEPLRMIDNRTSWRSNKSAKWNSLSEKMSRKTSVCFFLSFLVVHTSSWEWCLWWSFAR